MEILGKPTINPWLFYSGKIAGYICIIAAILKMIGIPAIRPDVPIVESYLAYALIVLGITLASVSFFNMGNSKRGVRGKENKKLNTGGLYRFSRNPMYIGVAIFIIASIIFLGNYVIAALGIYSIVAYHLIIKGEESLLNKRFGKRYSAYCKKVRRYI